MRRSKTHPQSITDYLVGDKAICRLWRQSSLHQGVAQACLVLGPSPRKPDVDVRRDR